MLIVTINHRDRTRSIGIHLRAFSIGSDAANLVHIADEPFIAPRHLEVAIREHDCLVTPVAAPPGSINGEPMEDRVLCGPSDVIELGDTRVTLRHLTAAMVTTMSPPSTFAMLVAGNPPPPGTVVATTLFRAVLADDPAEHALLDAIRARPSDVSARSVYADWLEQRGLTTKAALVRGEDVERARVLADTDGAWRAVASCAPIACREGNCPRTWNALAAVPNDERTRACEACAQWVHYSVDSATWSEGVAYGPHCVRDVELVAEARPLTPGELWARKPL